ncbi:hypothetical protein [Kitasatospora brasiliensis]|uniref:hypothetical protein n=1 Tax=Kitasatospora brasiliensis TaxID=3058040 RepID=UPI0029314117|nr:hypothetical protein [Kitasatospora sp. K002]
MTSVALYRATADIDLACLRRTFPALRCLHISFTGLFGIVDLTPLRGMPELTIEVRGDCHLVGTEHFQPGSVEHHP